MYLQNHVQLVSGQTLLLPSSTPRGAPTLSEGTTDTHGVLRANRMSMPPHDLPPYQTQDHTATNDHISQHHHLLPQHPRLSHNTNTASSTRTTSRNQIGSNRNFPHKPALIVINPGHISSDGPHDLISNRTLDNSHFQRLEHNDAILHDQTNASSYLLSTDESKGGKRLPGMGVSSRGLDSHSGGAFHVVPRSNRPEGSDRKSTGFSNSSIHKPTLTVVPPPAVPDLPTDSGKVEKFPANQQYGRACNGAGQEDEEGWLLQLQHQQHEGQRVQQQQQSEYIRALQGQEQQKYYHQRLLQHEEHLYQHRTLPHQKQLYEHQTLLQLPEQPNQHLTSLQQGMQQQQQWKHQGLHQLEQQQHQNQKSLQENRNQHMIPNHNEITSPFDMVNSSSRDHNSNDRHYHQHPNDHYPPPQQHHNLPPVSSHLLRTSAFSPTSSASFSLSHLNSEAKLVNSNIPVILISSPPAQEDNRQHAGSPHSSLLSPKHVDDASMKPRTSATTLLVPPSRTCHQRSRSANPPKSRPLNLYRPDPPPRPLNLSRPNPPPRPSNLRRSHSQPRPLNLSTSDPHSLRHVDFQPIDKPYNTHLNVDTPLDKTPPPEPPLRISSSLQLPPISVWLEDRTHPLAVISSTLQKPSSNLHDSSNASSLERQARKDQGSATLQLPKCYLNSSHQDERTSFSAAAIFISPTLQKPLPYLQDPSQTAPLPPPSQSSSQLQLPPPHQDLLLVPQEKNVSSLTSSDRISPTLQSSPHHHREPSHKPSMEKPELPLRMSSSQQRPISYHGDLNPMPLQERPQPPAPPTRMSSTMQVSPSRKRDLSRSLPSVITSTELSTRVPTLVHSQYNPKEDLSSLTPPCSTTNARSSPVSRDTKQHALATVEDLSNVKLKPIRDSSARPIDFNPVSPGEMTTGTLNSRLRSTSGKFSNIYTTERTTLPPPPAPDDLDELPPPPPAHELVLSPEDLAILAADSGRLHQHTGSSCIHFPTAPAHSPAGRFQTVNMSNMDFEIPDDIDLSKCPGLVEITKSTPNWKRDMIEKKNQEKIEEYVKKIQKEREQEAKWKNVPEWKKKILQKKDDEEATGSTATPETKTGSKNPEIKVQLKKATKKPPPPPPKEVKEDYSSLKPKGDIVPAALSIDPEELAAMPPWKRELLFKRDKVPVTFSNEFNPDEDSAADSDKTTS